MDVVLDFGSKIRNLESCIDASSWSRYALFWLCARLGDFIHVSGIDRLVGYDSFPSQHMM